MELLLGWDRFEDFGGELKRRGSEGDEAKTFSLGTTKFNNFRLLLVWVCFGYFIMNKWINVIVILDR